MAMQMSPGSPPSTPRHQSKLNPVTPSTCDTTPLFAPEELALSPICVPQSSVRWEVPSAVVAAEANVPVVLDSVAVALARLLPTTPNAKDIGEQDKSSTTHWNLNDTFALRNFAPMQGWACPVEPRTPRRSPAQEARDASRSPPPAPKPNKPKLSKALQENDLVEVVDILAKNPKLADMPLWDGSNEFPLERAIRLQCDEMIIQILKDRGAHVSNSENIEKNKMNNIRILSEHATW